PMEERAVDGDPFDAECRRKHLPPGVLLPHAIRDLHVYVLEGHLVEPILVEQVNQWPYLHSRRVHGHDEDGYAGVLRAVRTGASRQPAILARVGPAGKKLAAVNHVVVALAHSPRLKRGQV